MEMQIRSEISDLLDDVERFAGRKFMLRRDIEAILELTRRHDQDQLLQDILFHAKFLANAYQVLSRAGNGSDDTEPLSREFAVNMEKEFSLLRIAIKESPEEIKTRFVETYFGMSQSGVSNLMALCSELAWLKNYSIDRRSAGQSALPGDKLGGRS